MALWCQPQRAILWPPCRTTANPWPWQCGYQKGQATAPIVLPSCNIRCCSVSFPGVQLSALRNPLLKCVKNHLLTILFLIHLARMHLQKKQYTTYHQSSIIHSDMSSKSKTECFIFFKVIILVIKNNIICLNSVQGSKHLTYKVVPQA